MLFCVCLFEKLSFQDIIKIYGRANMCKMRVFLNLLTSPILLEIIIPVSK